MSHEEGLAPETQRRLDEVLRAHDDDKVGEAAYRAAALEFMGYLWTRPTAERVEASRRLENHVGARAFKPIARRVLSPDAQLRLAQALVDWDAANDESEARAIVEEVERWSIEEFPDEVVEIGAQLSEHLVRRRYGDPDLALIGTDPVSGRTIWASGDRQFEFFTDTGLREMD